MAIQNEFSIVIAITIANVYGYPTADFHNTALNYAVAFTQAIVPGTKWCGDGDIAQHPNDFGIHIQVDMCCRDHDYCDDIIPTGQSKYGLWNDGEYTRLHCKCDDQFFNCLRASTEAVSTLIGTGYFTVLDQKCYDHRPPATCIEFELEFGGRRRCIKYSYNTNLDPVWQWFDLQKYPLLS